MKTLLVSFAKIVGKGLLVSVFFLLSCKNDVKITVPAVYLVDKEIEVYINRFVAEAKTRGIEIKLENLIASFTTEPVREICGESQQTISDPTQQRKITIVKDQLCWSIQPDYSKEALIFHELGHAMLGRIKHRDDLLPNGSPASIMTTSFEAPYSPCIYPIGGDNSCDNRSRRQYYIDELFNDKTAVPTWAK